MMRYRSRRGRQQEFQELNVTPFMNLMVVLVPFLLILAVFTRMTVHELNLPGQAEASEDAPKLELQIVMRADRLILSDRNRGTLHEIVNVEGAYDIQSLSRYLLELKEQAPDVDTASILLEPQVNYQSLVSVMDAVRMSERRQGERRVRVELFPQVSIGEAPASEGGGPSA